MGIVLGILAHGGGSSGATVYETELRGGFKGKLRTACLVVGKLGAGILDRFKALAFRGNVYEEPTIEMSDAQVEAWLLDICAREGLSDLGQHGWLRRTPEAVTKLVNVWNQHPAPTNDDDLEMAGGDGYYGPTPHVAMHYFAQRVERAVYTECTIHKVEVHKAENGEQVSPYDNGFRLWVEPWLVNPHLTPKQNQGMLLPREHVAVVAGYRRLIDAGGEPIEPMQSRFRRELRSSEYDLLAQARQYALVQTGRIKPKKIGTDTASGYILDKL